MRPTRKRQWFLRPLWRDPSFIFCFLLAALAYAAMLPWLWPKAVNPFYKLLVIAYFFVLWLLVCALVSVPIGVIRGYWQGRADADANAADPEHKPTTAQAAIRVSGRMAGRYLSRKSRSADR